MKICDFVVQETDSYRKAKKSLLKKFRHIDEDVKEFLLGVKSIEELGTPLGGGFYKARIPNSDKNRGKSRGYRHPAASS